ncbi:hypothetical protein HMPREF3227_01543 [Corynebacterium sp. CMW7794]|nr:hypothetical protein HMPREF0307_00307 [Corynebacterium sp. DNF00584]KXI17517.1 hypothetical protein HMPREF3227_01543 [Corynebacterium sp. CMW7794]
MTRKSLEATAVAFEQAPAARVGIVVLQRCECEVSRSISVKSQQRMMHA